MWVDFAGNVRVALQVAAKSAACSAPFVVVVGAEKVVLDASSAATDWVPLAAAGIPDSATIAAEVAADVIEEVVDTAGWGGARRQVPTVSAITHCL